MLEAGLEAGTEAGGEEFNPDDRALCPDEACIGVLDHSGRCKECGRQGTPAVGSGGAGAAAMPAESDAAASEVAAAKAVPESAEDGDLAEAADSGDDFADRQLCTDPSCIGVLDAAGRCKECGRSAASESN